MDEISGLGIIKLLGLDTYDTLTMGVKFESNKVLLEVTNDYTQVIVLDLKKAIVNLDIRSLGHYKIQQGVLQQRLSKYYSFESLHNVFGGYNNFMNKLKEENIESKDPYPWLDPDGSRRKMTYRQIIESTIDLHQSCLSKEEVYKLLVEYREAFSHREKIGTCPNIEVDLQVIDKSPFFIRSFHVKEEDKPMIDKEMQRLVHLGILKKDMSPYSSCIILIARNNSSLKRIITDIRFLNSRLQRVNLTFPLIRDAFAILGSSKYVCQLVLDPKDAYHIIQLLENS